MRFVCSAEGAALPDIIRTEISGSATLLSSFHVIKLEGERQILTWRYFSSMTNQNAPLKNIPTHCVWLIFVLG